MALKKLAEKAKEMMPLNWGKHPVRVQDEARQSLPVAPNDMQRMFDGIFEDFFSRRFGENWLAPFTEPLGRFGESLPRIDLEETDRELQVTAEVPGMEAEDIDVTIGDRCVIIRGSKSSEREDSKKGYHMKEIRSGSFYRSIPLPIAVDRDGVEAHCKNGQLRLTLPKTDAGRIAVKKIEVK
jgi:HSP20 family protein